MIIFEKEAFVEFAKKKNPIAEKLYYKRFFILSRSQKVKWYTVVGIKTNSPKKYIVVVEGTVVEGFDIGGLTVHATTVETVLKGLYPNEEFATEYFSSVGKFIYYSPNGKSQDDCAVRALSKIEGITWREAFLLLSETGAEEESLIQYEHVVSKTLEKLGYNEYKVEKGKPVQLNLITKKIDKGIAFVKGHVVAIVEGNYYDSWDSGLENVQKYYKKE